MVMRATYLISGLLLLVAVGVVAQSPQQEKPLDSQPARDVVKPAPSSPAAVTNPGAIVMDYKMELLDKDNDDHVSRKEAAGVPTLAKVFDKFDRNRDGRLDRAELEAAEKDQPR
jgi:hypothetical protein